MKIYTKKGDDGTTGLIGGTRVSKSDLRIEAYGTVDELNSWIGVIRDLEAGKRYEKELIDVQQELFTIGSHLANDAAKSRMQLPEISSDAISSLEAQIDLMNDDLPEMKNFVLPGGHPAVSQIHVARCVCRRAERRVEEMRHKTDVDPVILEYLNRLSDYLFVLSRQVNQDQHGKEVPWIPREA